MAFYLFSFIAICLVNIKLVHGESSPLRVQLTRSISEANLIEPMKHLANRFGNDLPNHLANTTLDGTDALLFMYEVILTPFMSKDANDFGNVWDAGQCPVDTPFDPVTRTCGSPTSGLPTGDIVD